MSVRRRSGARSPFPWFGGKQRLAENIIALFPAHAVYVEFDVLSTAGARSVDRTRDRRLEVVWASPRTAHPTLFTAEATA